MAPYPGEKVFSLDPDTHFHRSPPDKVYTRLHDDEVANVNGLPEIDAVNRHRNACLPGVTNCGDCSGRIHHSEYDTAEHVPKIIGVLRHHDLGSLVIRIGDAPGGFGMAHDFHCGFIVLLANILQDKLYSGLD